VVWVGGPPGFKTTLFQRYSAEANAFFPSSVTIRQGDTIQWQGMSAVPGYPVNFHTVDIPRPGGRDLPLFQRIGGLVTGDRDAAGNLFWFNGKPNLGNYLPLFHAIGGSVYDRRSRVASGFPFSPAPFVIKFTKPGTYTYYCDVHYDMRGVIVVLPRARKVPSGRIYAAAVRNQASRDLGIAKALARVKVHGPRVSLGEAGKSNVEVLAFFPARLHVRRGTTVTFSMSALTGELHTVTFGPRAYLTQLTNSYLAIGSPFDPAAIYPSSGRMPIQVSLGSHGNGFASSGPLDNDPGTPQLSWSKFTFTRRGIYTFRCLVHTFMHGTVAVS
jgi:plastocyanin